MKRLVFALALAAAACKPVEKEAGLVVRITVPAGSESKCLQLEIASGGSQRLSSPAVIGEKTIITVGVAQGTFPAMVDLRALGFTDETCQTRAREESAVVTSGFGLAPVPEVKLTLMKVAPKNETNCADGLDDDLDQAIDCADSDCDAQPCTSTLVCVEETRCTNGSCGGGRPKRCDRPPTGCFASLGACVSSSGGCEYELRTQNGCNDGDLCTTQDRCLDDGGCTGSPVSCAQTTNSCLESMGTCADGGCTYLAKNDAGCDDRANCTIADTCSNGICEGTRVLCEATSCRAFDNRCFEDGGCDFTTVDAGTPCDGGLCSIAGDCLPRFPYQPVNFEVVQLRAPPAAPTILDCGETIIDTSGSGLPRPTNWCRNQPFEASYIQQPGGPSALLVSMSGLIVSADAGLVLRGDKPVIFGVFGDVSITGSIVSSAGSHVCTSGVGGDGSGTIAFSGGAGAGFVDHGGAGGNGFEVVTVQGPGGGGIEVNLSPTPLRSGCPGGRGGNATAPASRGGGGLQISASGTLALNGVVAAPGEGGSGGRGGGAYSGGNGGGAGGVVVLEANELVISGGAVTANGGSGGEGGAALVGGADGHPGNVDSATVASGGGDAVVLGGNGGPGGSTTPPDKGQDNANGGGGGGSGGLVFVRGASTCSIGPSVVFSPERRDGGCP